MKIMSNGNNHRDIKFNGEESFPVKKGTRKPCISIRYETFLKINEAQFVSKKNGHRAKMLIQNLYC